MRVGCSAVGYKPIVGHVVPDGMGEGFDVGSYMDAKIIITYYIKER